MFTLTLGWSLSTDQIAFLMVGTNAPASQRAQTTNDRVVSAQCHCVVVVYTVLESLIASDICFTSPTTPTMVNMGEPVPRRHERSFQ